MEDRPIGNLLIEAGVLTKYQLKVALKEHKINNTRIGDQLVELDYVTENQVIQALSLQSGMDYVNLRNIQEIPQNVVDKLTFKVCDEHCAMPFKEEDGTLYVAISDPSNLTAIDDIRFVVVQPVVPLLDSADSIREAMEKYYADQIDAMEKMLAGYDGDDMTFLEEFDEGIEDISKQADSRPVIKLLNLIMENAVRDEASDIHIEPYEDSFRVRYRVDGVLYEMDPPPRQMARALVARVKIISKLNISETRLPQDGRIAIKVFGRAIDLRVSTVPTKFGESAVLRVLDQGVVSLDLHNLRMSADEMATFHKIIHRPSGIVLVTGPTGSGKTTTLYACLNEINKEDIKILTNEDPVEYNIDGLIQVPINAEAGLTFSKSLRAALRQDPDVILVGEIRDKETATIAVEASLTGHLVFSTLHTNDAPSTITRLTDMGVENFLITATVDAIIAQRLVRTICPDCKESYVPTDDSLLQLGIDPASIGSEIQFFRGTGCLKCRKTGYRGRMALYEILEMNQTIIELVLKEVSSQELMEAAINGGMKPLREVGIQKVFDGLTTIDEVTMATVSME